MGSMRASDQATVSNSHMFHRTEKIKICSTARWTGFITARRYSETVGKSDEVGTHSAS